MKKGGKKREQSNGEQITAKPVATIPEKKEISSINDELRVNIALGTLTLFITACLLYVLNNLIYNNYHPDIAAILDKVLPLTICAPGSFFPEPVERMQYQLSLVCTPVFIFGVFSLLRMKKDLLVKNQTLAFAINILGLIVFAIFTFVVFKQNLLYVHFYMFHNDPNTDIETTTFFFSNNLITKLSVIIGTVFYFIVACGYYFYARMPETNVKKITVNIISCVIVFVVLLDLIYYNVFDVAVQEWGRLMETNAVLYSITQVFVGKSLLVDTFCQYGMYAWILGPVFKLIGLTTFKFSLVMGVLNALGYLLVFFGIRKILKNDLFALILFLCVVFWHYWQARIPFESTPRYYYQYWPIRSLFPCIAFFLIVLFQTGSRRIKQITLPVLAIASSLAIFWNIDTGIVVYGATFFALVFSTFNDVPLKESIKRSIVYAVWMLGGLFLVILLFFVTTKIKSGSWPDFKHFSDFQNIFYISGFFMLPMSALHFWNLPVAVYLIGGIYCVYYFKKNQPTDVPVVAFLFILGLGLFAYFQGRSFDITINAVMYPAIIILGIFCNKLFASVITHKPRFHESVILFFVSFLFIADGAFSMLFHMPSIHSFSYDNAHVQNPEKDNILNKQMDFVLNNIPRKDTVLILSKDFESYFYSAGSYYNPLLLAGSTEMFFKSEINTLCDLIRTTKYPIILDATRPWINSDTIIRTLEKYTTIQKEIGPDHSMLLLKPGKQPAPKRLAPDANTLYYNGLGAFSKYINPTTKLALPENFTIELYVSLDSSKLVAGNLMFTNNSKTTPTSGLLAMQNGADLTQYMFTYGNGAMWCGGALCKLSCTTENHLVIKVQKNIITVYNNNVLCGTGNTNSVIKNSDGIFFINSAFAGTVHEIKISNQ